MSQRPVAAAVLRMALGALICGPAQAQADFPNRNVTIVVPFPAGGTADLLCRYAAEKASAAFGQQVVIENRPGGAGGRVGIEQVLRAPPDGYTLLCSTQLSYSITHLLFAKTSFDPRPLEPISVLATYPLIIIVRKDFPANDLKGFIDYAKANPGKVTYASQGNGSTSHLSAQMLATMAGIEIVHVPYKGEGPALVDLTAGRVDIFIGNISAALRFEKARQAKFLGLASRTRSPVAPDVPTTAELGLPDLIAITWFAFVAPPGTPDAIVQKVNTDIAAALKLPDVRSRFLDLGAEPQGGTTAATASFIKEEEVRWRLVIRSANVTLE
jgi:tripartite-type tricarboxylate transporter receptor subunit TctC